MERIIGEFAAALEEPERLDEFHCFEAKGSDLWEVTMHLLHSGNFLTLSHLARPAEPPPDRAASWLVDQMVGAVDPQSAPRNPRGVL